MSTSRIALVTSAEYAALTPSDRLLQDALLRRGLAAEPAVWTDPAVDWARYELAIVRSPWDYFLRLPEFLAWIDRVEAAGVRLQNPPSVLRWNTHKHYLRELGERGVPLPPSLWIDAGTTPDVNALLAERQWGRIVVKPAVSGGAHETWIGEAPLDPPAVARVHRMTAAGDVLVQPFLDSVVDDGELSLIFIGGQFSHAVCKRAKAGDFRVQETHGGTTEPVAVTAEQVALGERIVALAPEPTLYARVDLVDGADGLLLMELEAVEPDLFMTTAPAAADRLAEEIVGRLRAPMRTAG